LIALVFEYINGFHDTANSIATVIATKALTPRQAVLMAALTNLVGAMWGTAVAKTIASELVDPNVISERILICAMAGAIIWNLATWYFGLPSSSSHALVGGLVGAAMAASNGWSVIVWSQPGDGMPWTWKGLLWKVIVPMFASPCTGFLTGFALMRLLYILLVRWKPRWVNALFGRAQLLSAAGMGFMHGTNDAQKTMGIVAMALVAGTSSGQLNHLPNWLSFLRLEGPTAGQPLDIPTWIQVVCALVMAAGTAAGGWRIIRTLGHKMVRLQPVHGFAAETTSAAIIGAATHFGIPVSTTHNISSAIMGVGAARRLNALRWTVVESMVWAWLLTIPVSGLLAFSAVWLFRLFGWMAPLDV
jgi:PiT family inorganic phosphate transporter